MLHFHIITLFPESIEPYFKASIIKRAVEDKKIKISLYNPKDFTKDWKERVDRRPYGGGPGMVLAPEPVLKAAEAALRKSKTPSSKSKRTQKPEILFFSPAGKQFDAAIAKKLSKKKHIVMIAGHYEGIDARVEKILKAKRISVGPFILTGGELPAAIVVDAVSRHAEGVLGDAMSLEENRVASPAVYTRPDVLVWKKRKHKVPDVLKSGNHAKIEAWKKSQLGIDEKREQE